MQTSNQTVIDRSNYAMSPEYIDWYSLGYKSYAEQRLTAMPKNDVQFRAYKDGRDAAADCLAD